VGVDGKGEKGGVGIEKEKAKWTEETKTKVGK
jgi:hypothetical protein